MRLRHFPFMMTSLVCLVIFLNQSICAVTTTFTTNTHIGSGDSSYENHDLIVDGATLTVDNAHDFNSLSLVNSAVVTCSDEGNTPTLRLELRLATDLTIDASSSIDVTGLGWASESGPGAGTHTETSGIGSGASHGGLGSPGRSKDLNGTAYGSAENPTTYGSGGGGASNNGGRGGGVILLSIGGTLDNEGTITANAGEPGSGGGGAGGSIQITASTITGLGTIQANGSSRGHSYAGGGAGGRILINTDTDPIPCAVTAYGKRGYLTAEYGAAGTVMVHLISAGTSSLIIHNNSNPGLITPFPSLSSPPHLLVSEGAQIEAQIPVETLSTWIGAGGLLTHPQTGPALEVNATGDIIIDVDGQINVDARGYTKEQGPGAGFSTEGSNIGSGAGHGGLGTTSSSINKLGLSYGSFITPTTFGSGGGGDEGRSGGGSVQLHAGATLRVDGIISANGDDSFSESGGGGSGGSIQAHATRLSGTGTITVNGSPRGHDLSGGGGGGRIALYQDADEFTGSLAAYGKRGYREYAGAGTIYTKNTGDPVGTLVIDNNEITDCIETPLDEDALFNLVVRAGAIAEAQRPLTLKTLEVGRLGILTHPEEGPKLQVDVSGDVLVEETGAISVDGKGYGASSGPGAGSENPSSNIGSGGGYGGNGGEDKSHNAGGITYGHPADPIELGSGGGGEGHSGGGSIYIETPGSIRIEGVVSSNGSSENVSGGGGSGGSIQLRAATISGNGSISANGSNRGHSYSGGGGGGRIALFTDDLETTISEHLSVDEGTSCYDDSLPGTIGVYSMTRPFIRSHTPSDAFNTPINQLEISWGGIIDPATFTVADIALSNPSGDPILVSNLTQSTQSEWTFEFPQQTGEGIYTVQIGPNVADASGELMDQDGDETGGEDPDDIYQGTFEIDTTPPEVLEMVPTDDIHAPIESVSVAFSEVIKGDTCLPADIQLAGPSGNVPVNTIKWLDKENWALIIDSQSQEGVYTLTIPTCVEDIAGNAMASSFQDTFEIKLPDLQPHSFHHPAEKRVQESFDVTWITDNIGAGDVPRSWRNAVYLSEDNTFDTGDTRLKAQWLSTNLTSGSSIDSEVSITLPTVDSGDYFLLLIVNDDDSVTESSTANNIIASPIKVRGFDYTVTVQTDTEVGFEQEPILLYGEARYDVDSSPAAGEPVQIHIRVRGKNRYLDVVPDSQGEFETTFYPVPGEAGHYTVRASHPAIISQASVQDTFSLLAMVIQPDKLKYRIVPGTPTTTSLTLKNVSEDPLTDFTHTLFSAPDNLEIDVEFPDEIAARDEATVQVSMLATDASIERDTLNVIFHSSEGTSDTLRLTLDILPEYPRLDCDPAYLRSGMVRAEQTIVECELTNNGGVPAHQIHIALPDVSWLSLASPENYAQIQPGESVPLTFLLQPLESATLGQYTGNMVIESSNATNIQLPFQFNCISDAVGDLVIDVVDELTYFTDEAPHVADARIVIKNALGELVTEGATNADGIATFIGLREGLHEVQVHAGEHSSVTRNIYVYPGIENTTTIFTSRQFVTYIWRVIETEIEDRYRIVVETIFETFVPAPVVTIDPKIVDLGEMTGGSMQVNFRLENIGLIQAEDVRLHSYVSSRYEIDLLTEEIGILGAHQSVVVPATITDTDYDPSSKGAHKVSDCSLRMGTFVTYAYECGDDDRYHLNEVKYKFPTIECSGQVVHSDPSYYAYGEGDYGDGGDYGPAVYFPTAEEEIELPMTCDLCEQAIIDNLTSCLRGYLPLDCVPAIINNAYDVYSSGGSASSVGGAAGGMLFSCLKDVPTGVGEAWNTFWCAYNIYHACDDIPDDKSSLKSSASFALFYPRPIWHSKLSDEMQELMDRLAQHALRLETAIEPWSYFLGSQSWFECPELEDIALGGEVGYDMFTNYVKESSDGGYLVTSDEAGQLRQDHEIPSCADLSGMITRWNNSVENYEMGVVNSTDYAEGMHSNFIAVDEMLDKLEDAIEAIEESQAEGDSSIFNSIHQTMLNMVTSLSNQPQGVCAQVRIQIVQEAVMTRSAFLATLDLSNNSDTEFIEDISVELVVTDSDGTTTTLAFAIAEPELTYITAVDGTGVLAPNETGRAQWTLVPTRDAAPTEPVPYQIGGTLIYSANSYINEIPLYPDTIWVYPDPILQLDYFHERYAYSDDPFTLDVVEPAIPYSLGLLVHNDGAGEAKNLTIESSQPQIIDNDKGLLVNFEIIGSQVGTEEVDRSLTVDLGNISSGNTVGARWLLTSSLQGEFHSFSATFEHLNPIGDAKISLFDSVEIHEMVHVVRVQSPDDDLQPDFLVDEVLDGEGIPDTIYTSQNFLLPVNPAVNIDTDGDVSVDHKVVTLTGDVPTGWVYFKVEDPAGDGKEWHLDRVLRSDGQEVLLDWNAWSTHRVVRDLQTQREDTFHLVDHDSTGEYTLYYNTDIPDVISDLWMFY